MQVQAWMVRSPLEPMVLERREETPGPGEALIEVAGCGVCHTDLGFYYDGVPTKHALPLALGHEIAGRVVLAGAGAERWLNQNVIVPAVIPCGACPACRAGRSSICPAQIFPGNDVHGGFATHVLVPARGLCPVPDLTDRAQNPLQLALADLSVIADAVSTPYQAVERSNLAPGDLAVFVGAGGVGAFGIQIAAARGAHVVAIDIDAGRLELVRAHGAEATFDSGRLDFKALKRELGAFAKHTGCPSWRTRVFETSGSVSGQETAFGLLGPGGYLSVVGYTANKATLRLANLMALDAVAQGNWGCAPELYPAVLELVLAGRVRVSPFVERRPLASINATFEDLHARRTTRRVILIPESSA
jgi:6-hydroxycyclohex-1-ene-1-carbonyl-CoA dehydrogenase